MTETTSAACSCGVIRLQLSAPPLSTFNCHCTICRKMNGAAFSTYVVFPKTALKVTEGGGEIGSMQAGDHGRKHFCRGCGTPLYGLHALHPEVCLVSLGALDQPERFPPAANVFCQSRLDWVPRLGEIPDFPQGMR